MSQNWRNIEDFVREKLGLLDGDSQPDWIAFERKLARALWRRRLRRAAGITGVLLLLGFSQTMISGDWKRPVEEDKLQAIKVLSRNQGFERTASQARPLQVVHSRLAEAQQIQEEKSLKPEPETSSVNSKHSIAATSISTAKTVFSPQEASQEDVQGESLNRMIEQVEALSLPSTETAIASTDYGISSSPVHFDSGLNRQRIKDELTDFTAYKYEPYISPFQEKKPWTYSLNIYPNFAFREFRIDRRKRAQLHSDFIDAMENAERSGLNMNLGFEVSRRVGAITYINTGVEYINNSYRAEFDFMNFRNANFNDATGEIVNYTIRKDPQRIAFSDVNSFHFLNFPLSVSYQPWATDHLRINLEFGFSALYFLKAQGSTIDYKTLDLIDLNERPYRKFMASSSLSIGVQYFVSRNMNIGIEPTMMYFTNSIYTEDNPFDVIPYSMGVNFKLQMKLQ